MPSAANGTDGDRPRVAEPAGGGHAPDGDSTATPAESAGLFARRPELFVGAAFAGGVAIAQALKAVRR